MNYSNSRVSYRQKVCNRKDEPIVSQQDCHAKKQSVGLTVPPSVLASADEVVE
jgi:hypothetical protein